jgi:hypothetical protein
MTAQADAWLVTGKTGVLGVRERHGDAIALTYDAQTQARAEPLFKAPALTAAEREDLAWAARELSWWRGAATIRRLLERTESVR